MMETKLASGFLSVLENITYLFIYSLGSALITMGTGDLSEEKAKAAGLVKRHAYGVLQVRHTKGLKLLQLKNPWSEVRWKGNFSAHDATNWTPDLKRELNYDPMQAQQVDNGTVC